MKKLIVFLTALLFGSVAFSAIDALNFSSPQQENDYHQLTQSLRCPQCQNNNIADSNATTAVDMRNKVFELLQEGKSKNDVVAYMVARYGNFVTYDPPVTAATAILWLAPFLLVVGGVIFLLKRKAKGQSAVKFDEVLTKEDHARLTALLNQKDK
ncbi:cytochrome c-type biogenesis protein [Rodentibacter myodis]|uniref:Cytochrome c-type biogenesis protein n=1 Tax=Rodentibacter myodis TaxID=1907939 RepID=A0A1V3JS95_9PAST|nr:cytochrome c-type biogenesis protein [Rodentibacter myodis]OOF59670.1 cytochrome C biogenesis protein [Rodentibacter myodis]